MSILPLESNQTPSKLAPAKVQLEERTTSETHKSASPSPLADMNIFDLQDIADSVDDTDMPQRFEETTEETSAAEPSLSLKKRSVMPMSSLAGRASDLSTSASRKSKSRSKAATSVGRSRRRGIRV